MTPGAEFWSVKVQGTYDPRKGIYRKNNSKFRRNGVSDIIGFYKGFFIALEVKTPTRRKVVSDEQKYFIECARANGQIGFVVCSVEETRDVLAIVNDLARKPRSVADDI